MQASIERPDPWRCMLVHVVGYDVLTTGSLVLLWVVVLRAADPRVLSALMVARLGLIIAHLHAEFAPVRRWRTHGLELADHELLAADDALRGGRARVVAVYVLSWMLGLALATGLAIQGIPVVLPLSAGDLAMASVFALALAFAVPVVLTAVFNNGVLAVRHELAAALHQRGLDVQRQPSTIMASLLALTAALTMGLFFGVSALAGVVYLRGERAQLALEQQRQVEIAALQLRGGELEHGAGVELVTRAELPTAVLDAEPLALGTLVARDLRAGQSMAAAPLDDGRWVISQAPIDEQLWPFVLFVVAIPLALAWPMSAAISSVTRSIVGQLRELGVVTRRVAETGELRSIARVVPLANDEVGALARDFNSMLTMLDELANVAQQVADGDLRVELERPGDVHDAFRSMVSRLHEMVVQMRETAVEVASAAARIRASSSDQAELAVGQSASVREVGAAAASLTSSAQDIASAARGVLDDAERALATTELVSEKIATLRSEASGVGDLLESIREVAKRSDLLALNGSLEATRAGVAGRGFSLVAAEMRRLAERVTATVADVRARVDGIETAGAGTVSATDESRDLAERTASTARQISAFTERQSLATRQVSQTLAQVAEAVGTSASASAGTHDAARLLAVEAARLEQLTGRFMLGDRS